jgi:two-component system response regulator ResD
MATILVVDDEISIQELVRLYLEKEGFRVESAGSGKEALERIDALKPSLVVLDIAARYEWFRRVPERHRADIPVLMLTARKDDIDKIRWDRWG